MKTAWNVVQAVTGCNPRWLRSGPNNTYFSTASAAS
jgi:hypothetical protein